MFHNASSEVIKLVVMKNNIKKYIIAVILIFAIVPTFAQKYKTEAGSKNYVVTNRTYSQVYSFSWMTNVPLGQSHNFLPKVSCNGAALSFSYFFTPNIGMGIDVAWSYNSKYYKPEVYMPSQNVAIYSSRKKKSEIFPIKAQFKYMINPNSFAKVFVGAGIGAINWNSYKEVQEIQSWENSWGFLMSPEVGVLVPFGRNSCWGAEAVAGYNWGTNNAQNCYFKLGICVAVF